MSTATAISRSFAPILTPKERRAFSCARLLAAADLRRRENCFELEVSDTLKRKFAHAGPGALVPPEIMFGTDEQLARSFGFRTLLATNGPSGGYTIGDEPIPLIEYIRPQSAVMRLGARTFPSFFGGDEGQNSKGAVSIAVEASSDEAEWVAEGASADGDHDSEFGAAVATPRRLYAQRTVSSQFLAQRPGAEQAVRRIIGSANGAAYDRGALVGDGGAQPLGLLNMGSGSGVTIVSHGSNGGASSYSKLIEAEGGPIAANSPGMTSGYAVSPNVRKHFKGVPQFSNTSIGCLQTINGVDFLSGFPSVATTYMRDDLTKGSGSSLGSFIYGEWQFLVVVMWGMLEIMSDRYSQAAQGKTVLFLDTFADVLHPRPDLFSIAKDIVT